MEKNDEKNYEKYNQGKILVRIDNFGILLNKIDKIIEEMCNIKRSIYHIEEREKLILKYYKIDDDTKDKVFKRFNDDYIPSKNEVEELKKIVSKSELE